MGMLSREVAEEFGKRTGLRLVETARTQYIRIAAGSEAYINELHGPYADPENNDVRLFLSYRTLRGYYSIDLLVQDKDDDAFLNSRAFGTEKYHGVRTQWTDSTVVR